MPHKTTLIPIVIVGKNGTRKNIRVTWGTIIEFMDRGIQVLAISGRPPQLRPLARSTAEGALALLESVHEEPTPPPPPKPKEPEIPEEPPMEEEEEEEIIPDGEEVSPNAVTIIIKGAKYGPDDDPEFNHVSVEVISRLKEKTAVIVSPILIIQVKNSHGQVVDFKQFPVRAGSLNFQQVFSFKSEAKTQLIKIQVFMWQNGLAIADDVSTNISFNAGVRPPTDRPTGTDFLPWVVVATAGAAFIGDKALKRRRRK